MPPQISNERIGLYLKTALQVLLEKGGSYPSREVSGEIKKRIDLTDYEKYVYPKTGYVRWESVLHFYSINAAKSGWLRKNQGIWYITEDGKKASTLSAQEIFSISRQKYDEWAKARKLAEPSEHEKGQPEESTVPGYELAQSNAKEEIKGYIKKLNPYEFQDLVAALFRGMGFYTPFIAEKGPDGGIDIVAYKDPIGAELPRTIVQVKHRPELTVSRSEVAALNSALQREGYIGVLVSSGGFSPAAQTEIRTANKHIKSIDLDNLIDLWEQHYEKISDEDKYRLPLKKIFFLAPEE